MNFNAAYTSARSSPRIPRITPRAFKEALSSGKAPTFSNARTFKRWKRLNERIGFFGIKPFHTDIKGRRHDEM